MTDNATAEQTYLADHATACPHCGDGRYMRRWLGEARLITSESPRQGPRVWVICYCAFCSGEWSEWYRLESISLR